MPRARRASEGGSVSEMLIVDTFTRLIFGDKDAYSSRELHIIQALRTVDPNVAFDSHDDMGEYLRALGVQEMIQLVARVREQLAEGLHNLQDAARGAVDAASHTPVNRRAH